MWLTLNTLCSDLTALKYINILQAKCSSYKPKEESLKILIDEIEMTYTYFT